jgi:hypothetical protein
MEELKTSLPFLKATEHKKYSISLSKFSIITQLQFKKSWLDIFLMEISKCLKRSKIIPLIFPIIDSMLKNQTEIETSLKRKILELKQKFINFIRSELGDNDMYGEIINTVMAVN